MAEPIQLDKAWMEKFINNDIQDFQGELEKIQKDKVPDTPEEHALLTGDTGATSIPALVNLLEESPHEGYSEIPSDTVLPLTIGPMVSEGAKATNGKSIQDTVKEVIQQLQAVIEGDVQLFDDIEDNLRDTLDTLLKTQGDSLDKISGEGMVDALEDVDDDLTNPPESGGGDDDDDEDDD